MEDDPDDHTSSAFVASPPLKNGELDDRASDDMANFPNTDDNPPVSFSKVNGSVTDPAGEPGEDRDSSDCDALVIDEGSDPTTKKPKLENEGGGEGEEFRHTNPYFSESIFDLSTQYRPQRPPKGNGLQPTVQFKCSKCFAAGFQSLQVLNEHHSTCTALPVPSPPTTPLPNNGTNIRVTRKVFLCSACGTYYENWNLFLHMREVHKRYICLYCLGMFPHAEKLSVHLVSKHNCNPKNYENVSEFLSIYKDPCFLMCCDCQTVFNEQEDFTNHSCIETPTPPKPLPLPQAETEPEAEPERLPEVQGKISEAACETSENLVSENDRTLSVERLELEEQEKERRSAQVVNSKECSDSNSEVNIVENEEESNAALETSDNSVDGDKKEEADNEEEEEEMERAEIKEERNDSIEPDDEPENFDIVINKNDVSEDSDNKLNDQSETDEAPEQEPLADDEEVEEEEEDAEEEQQQQQPEVETEVRKVPKVTLRLPKITTPYDPADEDDEEDYQSEDSEKLTMEVEKENNSDVDVVNEQLENESDGVNVNQGEEVKVGTSLATAGPDVPVIELELEQPLDKFDIKLLLQKCLRSTVGGCLYCNHARKIAVNGKQLGLHAIAEHRYSAIVKSITAEELIPESFNTRIKESLNELENVYFNLESASTEGGVTFSHLFECFQCRYSTTVHKELYLHNRKLHAKSILLCTMCKTSFYSYCELVCHLCPGLYVLERDVQFRCCLCVSDDLPSAFRLMVHLRKRHHVCDVCLEMCHDQSRLSNHVWKHKLHHLCYRCGIAYRNKPDITKHLYWKHGTESVLCKKCLQKKWPHVYHFCIPPGSFSCEECSLSFARAVSLMVHKRLHTDVYPHVCSEEGCSEKFISKKLLAKHEYKHRQPIEEVKQEEEVKKEEVEEIKNDNHETKEEEKETKEEEVVEEKPVEKPKPKVDVYDLPELNLSESDSSDSEDESPKQTLANADQAKPETTDPILEIPQGDDILKTDEPAAEKKIDSEENPIPVLENIWDDFKNYQANIAKLDILTDVGNEDNDGQPEILTDIEPPLTLELALRDHDYCAPTMDTLKEEEGLPQPASEKDTSADHDYCNAKEKEKKEVNAMNNHKRNNAKDSSDSSSDSDSSSCTCGSNCSCSSASSSSSSSSDSSESDSSSEEGRRRQQMRREKRRQKKPKKETENVTVDVEAVVNENPTPNPQQNQQQQQQQPQPVITPCDAPIRESDLETTESDTDEDFYDKEPQKLANKLLAEKREKLLQMAGIGPYINGSMIDSRPSTPSLIPEDKRPSKKKSKSKKKKKRKSSKHEVERMEVNNTNNYPLTLTLPKNSPVRSPTVVGSLPVNVHLPPVNNAGESDSNTRASKRRRVPNKFYGYSSDEEGEKLTPVQQSIKMRKLEVQTPKSPLVVPPLTIKAAPSTPTVEPISIRMSSKPGEMKVQPLRLPFAKRVAPKLKPLKPSPPPPPPAVVPQPQDSNSDSNSTSSDDEPKMSINVSGPLPPPMGSKPKETPALYCYCRCPYDEVSEMIGCDSDDCAIEWFHFECVGIMVPPKGQWYCPDCRKKKQQRREAFHTQM